MGDLTRKMKKAVRMPPGALIKAVIGMIGKRVRGSIIRLFPLEMSDKIFLGAVGYKTVDDFLKRELPPFFFRPEERGSITQKIKDIYPASVESTGKDADEICRHVFDLLGSGKRELGDKIDWHLDFKSGFRWNPKTRYAGTGNHVTCYLNKGIHADVKVPWELSRCQHFVTLGKAHWYTDNEKYAVEFVSQVREWIGRNPVELGANWACTMDVAIRAVNWIWGYYFFCRSGALTREFKVEFQKSLFMHGGFIINNLEFSSIRGNHYLSDIAGLVYLGIFFRESENGKRWLKKGLAALEEEMQYQVYPDGVDFEASISYHRLVTELFLSPTLLCLKNGIAFPRWYMQKLEKMLEFVMYYSRPDGMSPQVGDNDDGRLHILADYGNWDRRDHRHLLATGAVLFRRADFKKAAGRFHEEAFWLTGSEGLEKFNGLPEPEETLRSRGFTDGGFYIMRHDNLYMILDGAPANAKATTGHRHNSRLSFELFAGDKSFVIDPGAYIYTADKEMRNLFRSTAYHNTVAIDGQEQNRFNDYELFSIGLDAAVKVNRWESGSAQDILDIEHNGYERLKEPVVHCRRIIFQKEAGYWIISDILRGRGVHRFELFWHFAPLKIEVDSNFPLVIKTLTGGSNLAIIPLRDDGVSIEVMDGWVSYRYGIKVKAPVVKYSRISAVPFVFSYAVYPYQGELDINDVISKLREVNATQLVR